MKNGLADDSPLNLQSIHFTQLPNFDPSLINEQTESTVKRMQNAIETGRLIRDKTMISMKYPLKTVCLVDADVQVLKGYELLEKYIKEELNCLELELKSTEDDYVVYKATADNREMGQAFGKKFDKAAKAAIENLSSDMIRQYLKTDNIEVNGLNITAGMLKISKDFKDEYQKSKKWAVASSMLSSVMLDTEQTDELKNMGLSREVTNRI